MLRVLACGLLFVSGYVLTAQSTFALRLRDDVPGFVPGMDGAQSIAFAITTLLSVLPLLAGRRFLGVFLVSSFILTGIGAYWWTTVPWDELVKESDFASSRPPRILDYLMVYAPVFTAAFYAAISRASVLRADHLARGVDPHEAKRAAAASFLAGSVALVLSTAMAAALMWLLATGRLRGIPSFTGAPAIVAAGLLVVLAYVLGSGSYVFGGQARARARGRAEGEGEREGDVAGKGQVVAKRKRAPG